MISECFNFQSHLIAAVHRVERGTVTKGYWINQQR